MGVELKPGRAFIWHNWGQKRHCPGPRLAPARDQQPLRIPKNSVPRPRPRGSGNGTGDPTSDPGTSMEVIWAPRPLNPRGRGLDSREARQAPTPALRASWLRPSTGELLHWEGRGGGVLFLPGGSGEFPSAGWRGYLKFSSRNHFSPPQEASRF